MAGGYGVTGDVIYSHSSSHSRYTLLLVSKIMILTVVEFTVLVGRSQSEGRMKLLLVNTELKYVLKRFALSPSEFVV